MVERELALLLMERRLQAGATFAEMVRAGDPDLAQLLLVRIAELRAKQRGVDLDLARLAPAATLDSMATRRDPDLVVLEQGGTYRLSPSSDRALAHGQRQTCQAERRGRPRDAAGGGAA